MNDDSSSGIETHAPAGDELRTFAGLLRDTRKRLRAGGIPDWEASAEWLATDALEVTRTELFSQGRCAARPEQTARLEEWIQRRLNREPVQYILGYAEFYGLRLQVDRRVLIPRPETELLAECVIQATEKMATPIRVLDVGTGSGCIALAVAAQVPAAEITAVDYSEEVLELARSNGDALGLNIRWLRWDIVEDAVVPDLERFSIVVSNPPYIPSAEAAELMPEVADYEPRAALFVEGDPLRFYHAILERSDDLLAPDGQIVFEVNPDFAQEIEHAMQVQYGLCSTGIVQDLAGLDRIVWGRRDG